MITFTTWQSVDWLIIYGFTSHSRIVHLCGDITIAGEGLQNLGLYARHSSEGPPHLVASYDTQEGVEDLF
jgi:hypothetical protein